MNPRARVASRPSTDLSRRRFHRAAIAATVGAAVGLGGCAADRGPLTVAYHPWPGYAPLELARNMGWWGTQVRALGTPSAGQSFEALRTGQVQAAALTLDEALLAQARGVAVSVVALFNLSAGADVVLARQPLARGAIPANLRLGHEAGMVGELMAVSWLETMGLRYDQISPVHVSPNRHEAAWRLGEVDALVTYEPVATRLLAHGARRVYDSSLLPAERPIADVLVVRRDRLAEHRDALSTLVPLVFAGQRHIRELPIDTAHRLSRWLGLPVDQLMDCFRGLRMTDWADNREWLSGRTPRLGPASNGLIAFMRGHHHGTDGPLLPPEAEPAFLSLEAPA